MVRLIARNQVILAKKYRSLDWPNLVGQTLWGFLALRHGAGLAFVRGKLEGIRLPVPRNPNRKIEEILNCNEREIRKVTSGFYWRVYFLLTRGGAD